jgi:hypothetical protein
LIKQITIDNLILPTRDINSLTTSNTDRAWAVNNNMEHELQSTPEAMQWVVHILDAKYEQIYITAPFHTLYPTMYPSSFMIINDHVGHLAQIIYDDNPFLIWHRKVKKIGTGLV